MPLPDFEGIEPLFQRKSDIPTISIEQFDSKWLKKEPAAASVRPKPKQLNKQSEKEKTKQKKKMQARKKTSYRSEL
jgi:phosphoribosylaminoimidazole carboxylase (NCAIR synthetase)